MSKHQWLGFSFVAAAALAAAMPGLAAPAKDQGKVLLRIEGHEAALATLSSPQSLVWDYTLLITNVGEGLLTTGVQDLGTGGAGEDDPARMSATRFHLPPADLAALVQRVNAAHLGQQTDCQSAVPFFTLSSGAFEPRQRLIWFGKGRRNEISAWKGSACGAEVTALLQQLAGLARAVYALPTER